MAEIIDQIVKISIQDAISSVETVDVNTVAIVGKVGATTTTPTAFTPSTEPMKALTAKAVAEAHGGSIKAICPDGKSMTIKVAL